MAADSKWLFGRARFLTSFCFLCVIPCFLLIGYAPKGHHGLLLLGLGLQGFFLNMPYAVVYSFPSLRYPKDVSGRVFGFSNGVAQFALFSPRSLRAIWWVGKCGQSGTISATSSCSGHCWPWLQ